MTDETIAHSDALGVTVTLVRSGGTDGAPVVFIDTVDSLDGEQGPRIRVCLNDAPIYTGIAYAPVDD